MVVAEIVQQPTPKAEPIARVVEILGNYADPGMEIEIALRKHDLPTEFSNDSREAAADSTATRCWPGSQGPPGPARPPVRDHRGETARDFDDAVCCLPLGKGKGWKLWVAIADVSHYVKPGDALDRDSGTAAIPCTSRAASSRCCRKRCRTSSARSTRGRPPDDGLRDGDHHGRRRAPLQVLPGGHPLPRAPHLHAGRGPCSRARSPSRPSTSRSTRRSRACTPSSRRSGRAGQARRHRLRLGRDADDLRRQGQDERIVRVVRNDAHR